MYCRKIKYKDYFDNDREDEFYFNLSKSELIKFMQTNNGYSLDQLVLRLTKKNNNKQLIEIFEKLLRLAYGVPSLDGRRFDKSDEVWKEFRETNAYDVLFMELIGDADKASEWLKNVLSKELMNQVISEFQKNPNGVPDELRDYIPKGILPERKGSGSDTATSTTVTPLFPG